jgi:ABC-type nickel/cobalt efflux system permease component RcnA
MPTAHDVTLSTSVMGAMLLGALHVLEPAHGRSIFHAILVGGSGRRRYVLMFGLAVTAAHTATVFILAAILYLASREFPAAAMTPWVKILGAGISLVVGLNILRRAVREGCSCSHLHSHGEEHAKDAVLWPMSLREALVLGLSGGMIPCQAVIALLAAATGAGQLSLSFILAIAFSLGLGISLQVIGLLTLSAKEKALQRFEISASAGRNLAIASGVIVLGLGVLATGLAVAEILSGGAH